MNDSRQAGFTIVELIVALFVGASLIGSVNLIYTNQTYLSQRGRDASLANAYAEGKVEELRSAGYLGLSDGTTSITNQLPTELNSPRTGSLVVSTPATGIKQAVITITYNSQGASKTQTYTAYIGELGVGQ